jgi:hypothetical protein
MTTGDRLGAGGPAPPGRESRLLCGGHRGPRALPAASGLPVLPAAAHHASPIRPSGSWIGSASASIGVYPALCDRLALASTGTSAAPVSVVGRRSADGSNARPMADPNAGLIPNERPQAVLRRPGRAKQGAPGRGPRARIRREGGAHTEGPCPPTPGAPGAGNKRLGGVDSEVARHTLLLLVRHFVAALSESLRRRCWGEQRAGARE